MRPTKPLKIFILEDDLWYGTMLEHYLSLNPDYQVSRFETEKAFFQQLHEQPDVVTLDYALAEGDADGSKVLKKIKERYPETEVIIISGQDQITTAVELLKSGAFDYIVKDEDTKDRLWNVLLHLQEIKGLKKEVEQLKNELKKNYDFSKVIIGQSESIQKVFALIDKAAKTNITVSLTGETGTGKEMVAKAIHYNSPRHKYPFVAINVAAIPPDLLESELFGHEKGAFTGAQSKRIGKFEEANKGTLFLDEIAEMDIHLQAKLLRVLQEREITRIGGNAVIPIDVRIIVATHRNLLKEVQEKKFREDLYYRLLGLPIELPPLRERGKDYLILAKHFIQSFCSDNRLPLKTLTPESIAKLKQYYFPGNIRELKSIIELAVVMSESDLIYPSDINIDASDQFGNLLFKETTLKEYEKQIIQYFLNKYNQDVIAVSKKLDIGKSTIYRMMQRGELIK
ncbi:sigma-54 dependent transcriptional regulator [Sediminibacterium sp. C3]|uniref:sigma-54-dependent transcriptional regulator n=2 Tax=Sediminibacterium TaxID=504481 RepID=UPI0003F959AA|nr:sigma-54 dependent transcriptional regulator [Sediminibacterium sp. C3]